MGISLNTVIEKRLISDAILASIPNECECGAEIEFTDSLRQVYCPNEKCAYKIAARLEAMAKAMKADGWGDSTCIEVCKQFNLVSPYQVFLLDKAVENGAIPNGVSAFAKKVESICDTEKRKVELWEVVKLAGIPSIETTAYKIFDGYDTLTDAFNDIEKGQVPFIAEKLGIKSTGSSVMAVSVYNTLIKYKEELLFGEKQFEIYKPTGQTIQIAITGGVSGFRNKGEFISYINNRYDGKLNAMLMNSVTAQVSILVADGDTTSNKFKTATRINQKHLEKLLADGKVTESEIGTYRSDRDIHAIGEQIMITNSIDIFDRLDKAYG